MSMIHYSIGNRDRLFAPTRESIIAQNKFFLERDIELLEKQISISESKRTYDNPSSKWENLQGPKCNYNRCSKIQGCGPDCTCLPYGWHGHRCIPSCCIRADGAPPCHIDFPNTPVHCSLPCHSYPVNCHDPTYNPYHWYQGGSFQYPKYPGFGGGGDPKGTTLPQNVWGYNSLNSKPVKKKKPSSSKNPPHAINNWMYDQ